MTREAATRWSYGLFAVFAALAVVVADHGRVSGSLLPGSTFALLPIVVVLAWIVMVTLNRIDSKHHYVQPVPQFDKASGRPQSIRAMRLLQAGAVFLALLFALLFVSAPWALRDKPILQQIGAVELSLFMLSCNLLSIRALKAKLKNPPQSPSTLTSPLDRE